MALWGGGMGKGTQCHCRCAAGRCSVRGAAAFWSEPMETCFSAPLAMPPSPPSFRGLPMMGTDMKALLSDAGRASSFMSEGSQASSLLCDASRAASLRVDKEPDRVPSLRFDTEAALHAWPRLDGHVSPGPDGRASPRGSVDGSPAEGSPRLTFDYLQQRNKQLHQTVVRKDIELEALKAELDKKNEELRALQRQLADTIRQAFDGKTGEAGPGCSISTDIGRLQPTTTAPLPAAGAATLACRSCAGVQVHTAPLPTCVTTDCTRCQYHRPRECRDGHAEPSVRRFPLALCISDMNSLWFC